MSRTRVIAVKYMQISWTESCVII